MQKTIFAIKFIFVLALLFCSCAKNPFRHIEVHGRILDSKTNSPLKVTINLWSGNTPGSKGGSKFDSITSNTDGTFDIKSKASWTTNDYYLEIIPTPNASSTLVKFRIKGNQDLDLGDVFI